MLGHAGRHHAGAGVGRPLGGSVRQPPDAGQVSHYRSGKLSANVRSEAHPKGEVRARLQGKTRANATGDSAASAK